MSLSSDTLERWLNDFREYEAASWIALLVGDAQRVLNIGPSWGRDYYTLIRDGHTVINMDIATQHHLENMIIGDITGKIPFPDSSFDAVLLTEVLEHLVEDWAALRETRRVLSADGRLIVSVPFYSDGPLYHVRIHSPRSIERLLAAAGFRVERVIYRGASIRATRSIHAVRRMLRPLRLDRHWYELVRGLDHRLGTQPWAARFANGAYILASKGDEVDWGQINREEFQHL